MKKKENKKLISKKMSFADVLHKYPETAEIFMEEGLHCLGCPMAMQETLEDGCLAHGLDVNKILKKLNKN